MQLILQADQRPKRNHKDENLPVLPQELYLLGKEFGPMLNQENIRSPITKYQRNWFIFFVMEGLHREDDGATEFWRIKDDHQTYFLHCHHWSDEKWKKSMAGGGGNKIRVLYWFIRSNLVPPSSSRSFRTQSHWFYFTGTMSLFRATCSSTFIMSDVQSIYIPWSIQDWHREDKIWATDRQYSFCLWIKWTKNTRILTRSTWMHHVMHSTCIKHGRNIRTRCIGSTSILLKRKDWGSIRHDRTPSFFSIPKVVRMETGEVIYEKVYASPRPPPKISLIHLFR